MVRTGRLEPYYQVFYLRGGLIAIWWYVPGISLFRAFFHLNVFSALNAYLSWFYK